MEQEIAELSKTLIEIYQKNLTFLKTYFPDIFQKIDKLTKDINEKIYTCKYSLEYINGYFDILNLDTNSWFYGTNSYNDADRRASNSNFTKDGSLDLLRKGIGGIQLANSDEIKDIAPVISYINSNVNLVDVEFDKIYKFVFIGVGLGFHIHEINRKLNPFTTLIIEPDLEIFRISLFVIDYTELQQDNEKLFLSIGDSSSERLMVFDMFYNYHNYMNYNVKHHLLIENDRYIFNELVNYFATNTATSFPYYKTIKNVNITKNFAIQQYKFLDFDLMLEKSILKDKPVLLIAAGPSLDEYTDWIKNNQNNFTIICVDVILRKLEKLSIVPDIVVSIDPSYLCAKYLTTDNPNFLQNSAVILLSQQHDDVIQLLKQNNTFISQSIPLFPKMGFLGSASNVGTVSYMIAVHLGATEIYTIGNDAAFNQQTGNRYAEDSSCLQNEALDLVQEKSNIISYYDVIEVKGNLQATVKTNRSLLVFKDSFESMTNELKRFYEYDTYNLSNGVYIDNFIPMTKNELENRVSKFKTSNIDIISLLNSVSSIIQTKDMDFKSDLNRFINILNRVKKHKKLRIKNKNEYLEQKIAIIIWILEQSKTLKLGIFGNIFLMYTELVDIYINFYLNIKNQPELFDEKHLTNLNEAWSNGAINFINEFIAIVKTKTQ